MNKPPLGIMRKNIFEKMRVQDISRAIHEYLYEDQIKYDLLIEWSKELTERLETLQKIDDITPVTPKTAFKKY
jgi:hypothetical protein